MVDGLGTDERERVRVNEMLMGLMLRLDSVPGVDSAVRDCRKRVIRRVVALQERVDALAQEANDSDTRDSTDSDQTMEARDHNSDPTWDDATVEADQTVHVDANQTIKESVDHNSNPILEDATMEVDHIVHVDVNHTMKECVVEEENLASGDEECVVNATHEAAREGGNASRTVGESGNKRADERDLKEVMEKVEEGNRKLQGMISELHEREASQNRMMNSLSRRVEALDKAVSKRRKTKKTHSCNARKGRYDL